MLRNMFLMVILDAICVVVAIFIAIVISIPAVYMVVNWSTMQQSDDSLNLLVDMYSGKGPEDNQTAFLYPENKAVLDLYDIDVACINKHIYLRMQE
jgi:hypothetical protein